MAKAIDLAELLNTDEKIEIARKHVDARAKVDEKDASRILWIGTMSSSDLPIAILNIDGRVRTISARRLYHFLKTGEQFMPLDAPVYADDPDNHVISPAKVYPTKRHRAS